MGTWKTSGILMFPHFGTHGIYEKSFGNLWIHCFPEHMIPHVVPLISLKQGFDRGTPVAPAAKNLKTHVFLGNLGFPRVPR